MCCFGAINRESMLFIYSVTKIILFLFHSVIIIIENSPEHLLRNNDGSNKKMQIDALSDSSSIIKTKGMRVRRGNRMKMILVRQHTITGIQLQTRTLSPYLYDRSYAEAGACSI